MATVEDLPAALADLGKTLAEAQFLLPTDRTKTAGEVRDDIVRQLEDYILPRYASLDAPLLAVVGGSTGSGKSTLVNSILREKLARASAIRPTTRRPLLIHNPADAHWFSDTRVLPGLARVTGKPDGESSHAELELAASKAVPEGLALLDSPDIDSVVEENRRLASQLLSAADLWVFLTTAARYADAIPWVLLEEAASRNIVVAIVLDRVPMGDAAQVRHDLAKRLAKEGLGTAPLFVVSEGLDDDGFVPERQAEPIRSWLRGIAHDAGARASVARQTLAGAVDRLLASKPKVMAGLEEQVEIRRLLAKDLDTAFGLAERSICDGLADGTLLRGEVLERWQELVGTGEWMKRLESGVSSLRDRIVGAVRGKQREREFEQVEEAIEDTLLQLLVAQAEEAIAAVEASWETRPGADSMRSAAMLGVRSHEERVKAGAAVVRAWQRELLEMVGSEGHSRRMTARVLSWSVNALGAALMIVIFASTSGLTGGEVAVAGGTAVLAERVLEAVFGDDAVRRMAKKARDSFTEHSSRFLEADREPFKKVLATLDSVEGTRDRVAGAFAAAAFAKSREVAR